MNAGAFYDMDGTLVSTNLVHSFLFVARNEPWLPDGLLKTASALAKLPAFAWVDRKSRMRFNEMLFAGFEGAYRDNLLEIARDHFEKVLHPNIYPGARDLVDRGRARGLRQVLVTGNLDFLVAPLVQELGLHDAICNRLEFRDGIATGRVVRPVIAGAGKARAIQEYARDHDIDLLESHAFSDSYSDLPMLSVVGRPAVINPDRRLKRTAGELQWPILEYRA
jgi:HAD superfamily hydrolase (TIGR01490 family)